MSWPHVHSDAHLDWPIPGHHPDPSRPPRKAGKPVPEAVRMAAPCKRDHSLGQPVPLAGPGRTASLYPPGPGGHIHVGRSEDVHGSAGGPKAGADNPDDALADADDADVLLLFPAQRPFSVLGSVQLDSNGDSILCCRLGQPAPHSKIWAKRPAIASPVGEGDFRRWKQRWK